ncbi:MAG: class I SAM-dependent methyltransferase [Gammaproteobacteria bacterium]|nr:class I SAM-dependent methyltransferase [Gammaproteobacteria bacterium]
MKLNEKNIFLQSKYNVTAFFYDILDYPWERRYRKWRPALVGDLRGKVLEAGVGTGRNLEFYHQDVELLGIELNTQMLRKAEKRKAKARCDATLINEDATVMSSVPSGQFDWVFSTFMCCVMRDDIQALAIEQFARVLKPGGRFRLLEMVYSKNERIRKKQAAFAPFVEKVYGARFDRNTLRYLEQSATLTVSSTSFLKDDTYLLIEGVRD